MENININVINIAGTNYPWRNSVRVAATTNQNTAALVGAVIDGITILSTDRVLLTAQTTATQNGIYVNNALSDDFQSGNSPYGIIVYVVQGTTYSGTIWLCQNIVSDIIGTNNIIFMQWQNSGSGFLNYAEMRALGDGTSTYILNLATSGVSYPIAAATTFLTSGMWSSTNNTIMTYTGAASKTFQLKFLFHLESSSSDTIFKFQFRVGGTTIITIPYEGDDLGPLYCQFIRTLTTNQTITVNVMPDHNGKFLTFHYINILAVAV